MAGSAIVNIARHVSLVVRWGSQIGSAGSESVVIAAAEVLAAGDVPVGPTGSRKLLEVGI